MLILIIVLYLICAACATFIRLMTITEACMILEEDYPDIYEKSPLKTTCNKSPMGQVMECFLKVGCIPLIHLIEIVNFITRKNEMVIELIQKNLDEYGY